MVSSLIDANSFLMGWLSLFVLARVFNNSKSKFDISFDYFELLIWSKLLLIVFDILDILKSLSSILIDFLMIPLFEI